MAGIGAIGLSNLFKTGFNGLGAAFQAAVNNAKSQNPGIGQVSDSRANNPLPKETGSAVVPGDDRRGPLTPDQVKQLAEARQQAANQQPVPPSMPQQVTS